MAVKALWDAGTQPRPTVATAFPWLHVHIAGGGQRGMAQGVLHHMHGGTPVQGVAGMGMVQPVRRDPVGQTDLLGRRPYNLPRDPW